MDYRVKIAQDVLAHPHKSILTLVGLLQIGLAAEALVLVDYSHGPIWFGKTSYMCPGYPPTIGKARRTTLSLSWGVASRNCGEELCRTSGGN